MKCQTSYLDKNLFSKERGREKKKGEKKEISTLVMYYFKE